MQHSTHTFHVRFEREIEEDLDIAKGNFPKLDKENDQLGRQCLLEAEAYRQIKGRCAVEKLVRRGGKYFVHAVMVYETEETDRDKARLEFCQQFQRKAYDRGGMAGFFKIKD